MPKEKTDLKTLSERRLETLTLQGFSPSSITWHNQGLRRFIQWCDSQKIQHPQVLTDQHLKSYQTLLAQSPLAIRTQNGHLAVVGAFLQWVVEDGKILNNPMKDLKLPKPPQRLPPMVLTQNEFERLLETPNLDTPLGVRDKTILELCYAAALRASEVVNLTLHNLDRERQLLWVQNSKRKKGRVIPLTDRAVKWWNHYEQTTYSDLWDKGKSKERFFLSFTGKPLHSRDCSGIISGYLKKAVPQKEGSCHLLRQSVATLLLENGCDLRYVQEFLGHKRLETTRLYAQVHIKALKEIYQRTHPSLRGD